MKLLQYKGPFLKSETIAAPNLRDKNVKYTKIGVSTNIFTNVLTEKLTPVNSILKANISITIDPVHPRQKPASPMNFYLSKNGIIEFDKFIADKINITFNEDFPASTTVDIGYEEVKYE